MNLSELMLEHLEYEKYPKDSAPIVHQKYRGLEDNEFSSAEERKRAEI